MSSDPWAVARAEQTELTPEEQDKILAEMRPGSIVAVPDYTLCNLRLQCLAMALAAPDGAQPPPLTDVIARARAYWRFIETGEDLVNGE